jgi:hypothetical protein
MPSLTMIAGGGRGSPSPATGLARVGYAGRAARCGWYAVGRTSVMSASLWSCQITCGHGNGRVASAEGLEPVKSRFWRPRRFPKLVDPLELRWGAHEIAKAARIGFPMGGSLT